MLKRCSSVYDEAGRFSPQYDESVIREMSTDTVITAIGQVPEIPEDFRLETGRGRTIQIDPVTLSTNRPGVFAGGDAVSGPATAVQALAMGRTAAIRIDDYLHHRYPRLMEGENESPIGELLPRTIEYIKKVERCQPLERPPQDRIHEFQPVEMVYDWDSAIKEARRCLRCGSGAEILFQDKCATCLTCLRACPYEVPELDESGTLHIPADQCQACGICVTQCPARAIVLRKPYDRRQIEEELAHVAREIKDNRSGPLVAGFCCQYGLYGSGTLAGLWRTGGMGVYIIPVLCVAKLEADHILEAFEIGVEGVFVAGCGEQCARESTTLWLANQVDKAGKVLDQIGLDRSRIGIFTPDHDSKDPVVWLDEFIEQVGGFYLGELIRKEVKIDSSHSKAVK